MNPNNENAGKIAAWALEKIADTVKDNSMIEIGKLKAKLRSRTIEVLKRNGLGPNSDEAGLVFSRLRDILEMEF